MLSNYFRRDDVTRSKNARRATIFYHELVSFEQNENGAKAKIRNRETEKESVIHCDYVIAADGAKSKIREQLGIKTEGRGTIGGYYMNIYFEADLREFIQGDAFGFSMVLHPEVLGALIPVDNVKMDLSCSLRSIKRRGARGLHYRTL